MTLRLRRMTGLLASLVASLLVTGVGHAAPPGSLYARLGGTKVVAAFVSDTIDQVAADPKLNSSFRDVNVARVKRELVVYICEIAGGGCKYTGATMREAHANLHITQAQFFGLVQIMRRQMRRHHVGLPERNRLLALLAPLEPKIVEVKIPPPAMKR